MTDRRRIRVVVVRGHIQTPWELRQWEALPADRFEVSYLAAAANAFDVGELGLRAVPIRTTRELLPGGRLFDIASSVLGERYFGLEEALAGADIVHAEELLFWFAAEAVRGRPPGAKVVQTVWETIPQMDAYRGWRAKQNRHAVLDGTDLFLPTTERARDALLLEGVAPDRMEVCPPGIDVDRFSARGLVAPPAEHVILSPGRLVWEKGHQDVLRAVAALERGLAGPPRRVRLRIVGSGPEESRLREHAAELGVADRVEIGSVPYDEMPSVFAAASCLVLASLPRADGARHPLDVPRAFWEEQFGMVLAEGMAAGLPIIAGDSGAIGEVIGDGGCLFAPGDWMGLARALADGPLARTPGERFEHDPARVERYSTGAAAGRLAAAYERVLGVSAPA